MIEASLILLGLVLLKAGIEELWWYVQDRYTQRRIKGRKIMTRIDGPLAVLLFLSMGCATPAKTITLRNMPSTIVIHRGDDISEVACASVIEPGTPTWGCSVLRRSEDNCEIYLDWIRGRGTDIHEFAHCAGHDEDEAESLSDPE